MSKYTIANFDSNKCETFTSEQIEIILMALAGLEEDEKLFGHNENARKCDEIWKKIFKITK